MLLYTDCYLVQGISVVHKVFFFYMSNIKKRWGFFLSSFFHSELIKWNKFFHWGSFTAKFTTVDPMKRKDCVRGLVLNQTFPLCKIYFTIKSEKSSEEKEKEGLSCHIFPLAIVPYWSLVLAWQTVHVALIIMLSVSQDQERIKTIG